MDVDKVNMTVGRLLDRSGERSCEEGGYGRKFVCDG